MFDGQGQTPATQEEGSNSLDESLARLFHRFDPLLDGAEDLPAAEIEELRAMAAIFDLSLDGPPAEIWTRLRAVLSRQTPSDAPAPGAFDGPLTLMVVEDDPEMAADLVDALTDAGHSVVGPFHSAEAAVAAAALHPVDLALLDINLSGDHSGADLARTLKSSWGTPALFLSGDVTAAARHAELSVGLVLKPYRPSQVLNAVRAAVERARS